MKRPRRRYAKETRDASAPTPIDNTRGVIQSWLAGAKRKTRRGSDDDMIRNATRGGLDAAYAGV